ncbi:hypothetical protein CL638_00035 [bacterium]|nr:hypothetical protein [bacterium]
MKTAAQITFPTWKTVTVGNLGSAQETHKRLKEREIKISRHWAGDMLERATFEGAEVTLHLVQVSLKELDLKDGATTTEIYAAAQRYGLALCPHETAAQLWLQYPDLLSRGERTLTAMEAIRDSVGYHCVFCLEHQGDGRWLDVSLGYPDSRWDDNDHWVFVRKD